MGVVRGKPGRLRSSTAFGVSAAVHGVLLGWLVLATPGEPPRKSIYDQEIRPHEEHLVWYNLRDRLPDVSPAPTGKDRRPPRAHKKFNQTLVAGKKDEPRERQMIWMPEPKAPTPKLPPLPNVLAVAPHPERPFVAPEMPKRIVAPAPLPEAPKTTLALDVPEYKAALPLPPRKKFTPPRVKTATKSAGALPEAPKAAALRLDVPVYNAALPLPPRKQFTPPPAPRRGKASPVAALPEAPTVGAPGGVASPAYHAAILPPPTREFTPPPPPKASGQGSGSVMLPDAPAAAALAEATPTPTMAIAGLDPAKLTDLPKPPGPQEAHFSAGPELRPKGGAGEGAGGVVVPGLLARGGTPSPTVAAPLPRPKWMDPLHPLDGVLPEAGARIPEPHALRVSDAPDALLAGRAIYTMAIQMPNITSYSGSWMVWFAERSTLSGPVDMQPPEPLRKVDPKYVATAVADRVEGKVRLSAIIRKDGSVDSVVLLRHLDPRLDQTAEQALAKWIFQPARRNGVAIDVDAVFEIPFFLAPKPSR